MFIILNLKKNMKAKYENYLNVVLLLIEKMLISIHQYQY